MPFRCAPRHQREWNPLDLCNVARYNLSQNSDLPALGNRLPSFCCLRAGVVAKALALFVVWDGIACKSSPDSVQKQSRYWAWFLCAFFNFTDFQPNLECFNLYQENICQGGISSKRWNPPPDKLEVIFGSMNASIYKYDSKFHPKTDRLLWKQAILTDQKQTKLYIPSTKKL